MNICNYVVSNPEFDFLMFFGLFYLLVKVFDLFSDLFWRFFDYLIERIKKK